MRRTYSYHSNTATASRLGDTVRRARILPSFSVRRDGIRPPAPVAAARGGGPRAGLAGCGASGPVTVAASRDIAEHLHSVHFGRSPLPPPPLFLFPHYFLLPFQISAPRFFTRETFHAVTRKHLTYFTAFQGSLTKTNVYPPSLHATRVPRGCKPGATEPLRPAEEQQRRRGARGGFNTRFLSPSAPAGPQPDARDGEGGDTPSAAGHPGCRGALGGFGERHRGCGVTYHICTPLPGDYRVISSVMQTMRSPITSNAVPANDAFGNGGSRGSREGGAGQSFLGSPAVFISSYFQTRRQRGSLQPPLSPLLG